MFNDLMQVEWESWQIVCQELKKVGVDINTAHPLAKAVTAWGEKLADLRASQERK